jgi:hypothetical protein
MRENIRVLLFWARLTSLRMMFSNSIQWELGFIAFLHYLMMEMPVRCKQAFPREEKCLLDHLSPFGTSCSPSFSPSLQLLIIRVLEARILSKSNNSVLLIIYHILGLDS